MASIFLDHRHFFDWVGSHGDRAVARRIPPQRRAVAVADLATVTPEPAGSRARAVAAGRFRWGGSG